MAFAKKVRARPRPGIFLMSGDPSVSVTDVALQCNFSQHGALLKGFSPGLRRAPVGNPAAFAPAVEFSTDHVQAGRKGVGDLDACYCEFSSRKVSKHSQEHFLQGFEVENSDKLPVSS